MAAIQINVADLNQVEVDTEKLAADTLRSQGTFLSEIEVKMVNLGIEIAFDYLKKLAADAAAKHTAGH